MAQLDHVQFETRSRERFPALDDIAQVDCTTHVAACIGRRMQTVMGWLHRYNGAPYDRAKAVWAAAASLGIELAPLAGYSPDPKPVEAP